MFPSDLRDIPAVKAIGHTQTEAQDILPGKDADFRGRYILLVEDNELNREIAVAILHAYGFWSILAENGAVAVEKIRTSDPPLCGICADGCRCRSWTDDHTGASVR